MEIVLVRGNLKRLAVVRQKDGLGHYPILVEYGDETREWVKETEIERIGVVARRRNRAHVPAMQQALPLDEIIGTRG